MKKAEFKSVFTMNSVPALKAMKQVSEYAKRFAAQFVKNPFSTTMLTAAKAANTAASGIGKAAGMTAKFIGLVAGVKVASFALDKVADGMHAITIGSIDAAAQVEDFETTFKVFLGTAGKAKERMDEIRKFSLTTPFQVPEVAKASQELEVLTHGMLSHGSALRMVGDIASGVGRDFGSVADSIGRLFTGIREGGDIGEPLLALRQMGAMTPKGSRNIHAMAATDSAAAWKLATDEFKRFDGMMTERSKTWSGMMSNFRDAVRNAMAEFGKPFMESLKPALDMVTNFIKLMTDKGAVLGKMLAGGLKYALGILFEGLAHPGEMLQLFRFGMDAVASSFIETLEDGLSRITANFSKMFGGSGLAKLMGFDSSKLTYSKGAAAKGQTASDKWAKFNAFMNFMADVGQDSLSDKLTPAASPAKKALAHMVSTSSLNNRAFGRKSVLPLRERRANRQAIRIEEMARNFLSTGQFTTANTGHVIHRGDRRGALARARELTREKTGVDKTNALLQIQIDKFDTAWLQKN